MSKGSNHGDTDGSSPPPPPSSSSSTKNTRWAFSSYKWQSLFIMLGFAVVVLLFYDVEVAEGLFDNSNKNSMERGSTQTKPSNNESVLTQQKQDKGNNNNENVNQDQQRQDILRIRGYRQFVEQQRTAYFAQLQSMYGNDHVQNMFLYWQSEQFTSVGKLLYTSTNKRQSWFRLKRKFMMKLLEAAIARRRHENEQQRPPPPREKEEHFARFIWANGGHSSSAGHGNFFWESYTAVMERAMIPFFTPLGVEFVAKNYAMGGTSSGEEVALCIESIFGMDVDVLTWDYGMMDSARHDHWKLLLYTYHTAMAGQNRPVALGMGFVTDRTRVKIYSELERLGMGAMYQNLPIFDRMVQAIPETQGQPAEVIQQMPSLVKQFKCGGVLEKGDPGCKDAKFNMMDCATRKGRVTWHPGWKLHALHGNALALFLIEVLLDAVESLEWLSEEEDLQDVHDRLALDEEESYANVFKNPIPDKLSPIANWINGGKDDDSEKPFGNINLRELYKRRSFCHTALLPAEIRYQGLLTQNNGSTFAYDTGIPQPQPTGAIKSNPDGDGSTTMRLAYDPKQRETNCTQNVGIDYKDFFYLDSIEGWKSLTLPNDEETKHYNFDTSQMLGMVIICLAGCEWNQCGNGDLRDEFDKGPLKMQVNGVAVTEFTKLGNCWALKNNGTIYKWAPNAQGKFQIQARVDAAEYSFVRFSSFILV